MQAIELFAKQVVRDIKSTASRSDYNHHLIIGRYIKLLLYCGVFVM